MEQVQRVTHNVTPIIEGPSLLQRAKALFTREAKEKTVYDLQIAFHRQSAGMRVHGQLTVTNREFNLDNRPINFSFIGVAVPPLMTPDVVYHLWMEAVNQGYIPHAIYSYKGVNN